MAEQPFSYADSGINYPLMDAFKNKALAIAGNEPEIVEFPNFYLVDVLEAVGSLSKLADMIYRENGQDFFYQLGWGNAATVLNDIIMTGAKPLTMKLFVAAGDQSWFENKEIGSSLLRGFGNAAKHSKASWNGGETQTLVDVIDQNSIVLAACATGIIEPKSRLLTDEKIEPSDRIVLVGSSGVHTNGITTVRKIFADEPEILIDAIKRNTVIYTPLIQKLLDESIGIHAASHITGHGWRKIMRSPRELTYIIDNVPKPQPIFRKIQERTNTSDEEMYGDYNMGAGFAIFVEPKSVSRLLHIADRLNYNAIDAGYVKNGPRQLVIEPFNIGFKGQSLQIR